MKGSHPRFLFVAFLVTLCFSIGGAGVKAVTGVESFNIATTYEIASKNLVDGDIVTLTENSGKIVLASPDMEGKILGVVDERAPFVYRTSEEGVPVVHQGEVYVNVLTEKEIRKGDLITLSGVPGKGMKSSDESYPVVGIAQEDLSSESAKGEVGMGRVLVTLRLVEQGVGSQHILSYYLRELGLSVLEVFTQPKQVELFARYFIAALITLLALFVSFRNFGKSIVQGLESIGRNPLAGKKIQAMIILNILLIAFINVGAIVLALFIVRY